MRTTLTIDDNLFKAIKQYAVENGISLKETVNQLLGRGLASHNPQQSQFIQETYAMGFPASLDLDRVLRLADALEDEEIVRKLELKK